MAVEVGARNGRRVEGLPLRYRPDDEQVGRSTLVGKEIMYDSGGISLMLGTWIVFFAVWFLLGVPMGPGYPANL